MSELTKDLGPLTRAGGPTPAKTLETEPAILPPPPSLVPGPAVAELPERIGRYHIERSPG